MGPVRNGGCSGAAPPADKGGLKGAGLLRSGSSTVDNGGLLGGVSRGELLAGGSVPQPGRFMLAAGGCSAARLGPRWRSSRFRLGHRHGGRGFLARRAAASALQALPDNLRDGVSSIELE